MNINEYQNIEFKKVLVERIEKNIKNYNQYTIGKNGIKIINNPKYDLKKHKVFKQNDLILGIGIDEINFNTKIKKGSCSPIYKIFKIDNNILDSLYGEYIIKKHLIKNKKYFTKKSTRREFEIIIKDLLKIQIPLIDINKQKLIGDFFTKIDQLIEINKQKNNLILELKNYYLNKIFSN